MGLHPDDRPFHHYSRKHRVIAWLSQTLFDNITYTVAHGPLKGMKRRGGLAWLPEAIAGSQSTPESEFWAKQNFSGLTVYDIGAFHGLLTLLFARGAKSVVSYEPNTRNHARLSENIRLNQLTNVRVRKVGIGEKAAVATMATAAGMPGGASITTDAVENWRRASLAVSTEQIQIVALDEDIRENALPKPDFIKIDTEGQELAALKGAHNTLLTHRPRLFLEIHGETMNLKRKAVAEIVSQLNDFGYTDILHIETGTKIVPSNSAIAARGHLYCCG